MNCLNMLSSTGLIAVVNSEASGYNTEMENDDYAAPVKPYQLKPSTELFSSSSEELDKDDKESDERLANTEW